MANRVTETEVRAIIETPLVGATVEAHITVANLTVTRVLGASNLSAEILKEIERWLAAHFVAVQDRRRSSTSTGDASDSYDGQTGMGLDFTAYGQQVKLLDPTGLLASAGKPAAFFEVL